MRANRISQQIGSVQSFLVIKEQTKWRRLSFRYLQHGLFCEDKLWYYIINGSALIFKIVTSFILDSPFANINKVL